MIEINLLRWRKKRIKHWQIMVVVLLMICFMLCLIGRYFFNKSLVAVTDSHPSHPIEIVKNNLFAIAGTVPLAELQLVGYLEIKDFFIGFLRLPDGEIREIKTGAFIGKENARILFLNKQKMVIEVNGSEVVKKYGI